MSDIVVPEDEPNRVFAVTDPSRLTAPAVIDAYRLWDRLRGDRRMPCRKDFSPRALAPHLAVISLIDVIDGGRDFRFRLLGSRVDAILQGHFTGTLVSAYPRPDGRRHVQEIYALCTEQRLPYMGTGRLWHLDMEYIRFMTLVLPFSDDDATVSQLLVANHFESIFKHSF